MSVSKLIANDTQLFVRFFSL